MFPKEISRSFLWKHEKDGTIQPVLPQFYIPYGMKRPAGENEHYPTPVYNTVTSNDGILRSPLRIKPSSEMIVFCFRKVTLTVVKGHYIRKLRFEC